MKTTQFSHRADVRTVLKIGDSPSNNDLVEQLIAPRSDLKLITATNGTSGIELANFIRPDVILLSNHPPNIDGNEVLKVLISSDATLNIPVIAVTSDAFPAQVAQGMQAGYFAYLTKPYMVSALMDTIDRALSNRQTLVC